MMGFNGYDSYGANPWMWVVGGLMMLLLAALVVWAVKAVGGHRTNNSGHAIEVLRTRLAAGEITHDEFEKTRRTLQG